jgi:hypothetical protein
MSGNESRQESVTGKQPGTRKYFYGSVGLLLVGLLVLAAGAVYGQPLVAVVGLLCWLMAGAVRYSWARRKYG